MAGCRSRRVNRYQLGVSVRVVQCKWDRLTSGATAGVREGKGKGYRRMPAANAMLVIIIVIEFIENITP